MRLRAVCALILCSLVLAGCSFSSYHGGRSVYGYGGGHAYHKGYSKDYSGHRRHGYGHGYGHSYGHGYGYGYGHGYGHGRHSGYTGGLYRH